MTVHAKQYWASRLAADAAQLEHRRQAGLNQAAEAAAVQVAAEVAADAMAEAAILA